MVSIGKDDDGKDVYINRVVTYNDKGYVVGSVDYTDIGSYSRVRGHADKIRLQYYKEIATKEAANTPKELKPLMQKLYQSTADDPELEGRLLQNRQVADEVAKEIQASYLEVAGEHLTVQQKEVQEEIKQAATTAYSLRKRVYRKLKNGVAPWVTRAAVAFGRGLVAGTTVISSFLLLNFVEMAPETALVLWSTSAIIMGSFAMWAENFFGPYLGRTGWVRGKTKKILDAFRMGFLMEAPDKYIFSPIVNAWRRLWADKYSVSKESVILPEERAATFSDTIGTMGKWALLEGILMYVFFLAVAVKEFSLTGVFPGEILGLWALTTAAHIAAEGTPLQGGGDTAVMTGIEYAEERSYKKRTGLDLATLYENARESTEELDKAINDTKYDVFTVKKNTKKLLSTFGITAVSLVTFPFIAANASGHSTYFFVKPFLETSPFFGLSWNTLMIWTTSAVIWTGILGFRYLRGRHGRESSDKKSFTERLGTGWVRQAAERLKGKENYSRFKCASPFLYQLGGH